ncbi:MAG: hypothetical protein GXO90_03545 [FCB group bacterium]|nr:hypothetical protein [FCB group bacterium]
MKKYTMSPLIAKYYNNWLSGPTLLGHPNDEKRFYKFIKACVRYSRKSKNGVWLKYFIERDLKEKYTEDYFNSVCLEAISIFDHIIDYLQVHIPDYSIEMKNPYYVASDLRRIIKDDGDPYMSEKEIENYLIEKFGDNWREKY